MKLACVTHDGESKVIIVEGNQMLDCSDLYSSVGAIIEGGEVAIQRLKERQQSPRKKWKYDMKLLQAPLQAKRNIICVGWNYLAHFEERERQDIALPEKPTVFTKATETVAGPYEEIIYSPEVTSKFDYEAELAVIIGKPVKHINEEQAFDYVFGYACANDLSARDIQQQHGGQWFLGKSLDKSCPMGPWIVTKDDVSNIQDLEISCKVNGQEVQRSNTNLMIFPIARIIAELSRVMTLLPGDIILTGTPEGIGAKRNPPLFLKNGDIVEVEIESIGQIQNRIVVQKNSLIGV